MSGNQIKTGENQQLSQELVFRIPKKTLNPEEENLESEFSKTQKGIKKRLQQAVIYGKAALKDFSKKQVYESSESGSTPFEAAFADFLNAPSIDAIDLSEYTGRVGSRILITVLDDFLVTSVYVKIQNSDGSVADEGFAAQGLFSTDWIYSATKDNPVLMGDKITVTASDLPGNDAQMDYFL